MEKPDILKKEGFMLILFALALAVLFNYFFYRKDPGISYILYVAALLGLFWWNARRDLIVQRNFGWFMLIPIVLLSAAFAIYSNPVLRALNFLLIPVLVVAHTLLVTGHNRVWAKLGFAVDIFRRAVLLPMQSLVQPFAFLTEELKPRENSAALDSGKKIATGLLISVPVLLVVLPLLSSADLVFHHYLTNLTKIRNLFNIKSAVNQGLIIFCVFAYIAGYLWSFKGNNAETKTDISIKQIIWDPTILLTVLSVINCVFLLFSVVQFSYLYGGENHSLPVAFTYAEYARRGFWELLAVTAINLAILLSTLAFVSKDNKFLYTATRCLLTLLVLFSLNLLFSAHFKMSLYEQAYGLTYLRMFVHYFIGFLLALFFIATINIWLGKPPLIKSYIITALVFYTVLNFINVDILIVRHNIEMYHKTGKLDFYYLHNLSYDIVPEVVKLADDKNPETAARIRDYLDTLENSLSRETSWPSINYSRYKAKQALTTLSH